MLIDVKPHTARNSIIRISTANTVCLSGCALWHGFRGAPLPYPRTDPVWFKWPALPIVAGLFAHRWPGVGRMLGAPDLHRVAALTWLDKPFGPTHPDVVWMYDSETMR